MSNNKYESTCNTEYECSNTKNESTCSPVKEAEHAAAEAEKAAILNMSQRAVLNTSRSAKYESTLTVQ